MKKLGKLLVFALLLFVPFMVYAEETKKAEKINVYLFRGEGCPHCAEAEEFFDSLSKDEEYSKYYKLVDFEVWYDEDNGKLMDDVAKELGTEANGVPFIVIGEKYFSGYATTMDEEIKTSIKEAYENSDYKDVVSNIKKGKKTTKKGTSPLVPIIIVSVIAVVTVIVMVFFTKEK